MSNYVTKENATVGAEVWVEFDNDGLYGVITEIDLASNDFAIKLTRGCGGYFRANTTHSFKLPTHAGSFAVMWKFSPTMNGFKLCKCRVECILEYGCKCGAVTEVADAA